MILVMDANALIALLYDESGGREVGEMLNDPANTCFVHAVNLCEVYYDHLRVSGEPTARQVVADLTSTRLIVRDDMDPEFWQAAGIHKAALRCISLADCFCLALALRVGGEIVTADHHEFDPVQQQGICSVRFIR